MLANTPTARNVYCPVRHQHETHACIAMVAIEDASQPNTQKNSRATSEARVLGLLIVSPVRFVRESLGQVLTHCNVGRVLKPNFDSLINAVA